MIIDCFHENRYLKSLNHSDFGLLVYFPTNCSDQSLDTYLVSLYDDVQTILPILISNSDRYRSQLLLYLVDFKST